MLANPPFPYLSTTPPQIYRQYFTAEECKTLDSCPLESALSEIGLLRILLLRLLASARRRTPLSLARHISILSAFSAAGLIMASLVRFHTRYVEAPHSLLDLLADMDPDDL